MKYLLTVALGLLIGGSGGLAIGYKWGQRSSNNMLLERGFDMGTAHGLSLATTPGAVIVDVNTGKRFRVPNNVDEWYED